MSGRHTSGVNTMADTSSTSAAKSLTDMAHWVPKVPARAPISVVPKGVPDPMQRLSSPIILPRISLGADSIAMVLCIVPNPAWPTPPIIKSVKERGYHGDQTNEMPIISTTRDPTANSRPW